MFTPHCHLNYHTATEQAALGCAAIDVGQVVFNFQTTQIVDSSAVACLLAWKRHAQAKNVSLVFVSLPQSLSHLMSLYGLDSFF